jgi:hypothetical protein
MASRRPRVCDFGCTGMPAVGWSRQVGQRGMPLSLDRANAFILSQMKALEMIGVVMRICSFGLVSWLGPLSPFMFVWAFNTIDAMLLTWCAAVRKDAAYTLLNSFWILIGIVGMARAGNLIG